MNISPVSPQPNRSFIKIAEEFLAELDRKLNEEINRKPDGGEPKEVKKALEKTRAALRASLNYYRRFEPII